MDDEYFRARAADVKDITDRLLKILSGDAVESGFLTKPVILMAEDLAPSETVQLEKDMLLGFITGAGLRAGERVLGRKDGGHRRRDRNPLCGSG